MSISSLIVGAVIGLLAGYLVSFKKSQKISAELTVAKTQLDEREKALAESAANVKSLSHEAVQAARLDLNQDATIRENAVRSIVTPLENQIKDLRTYIDQQKALVDQDYGALKLSAENLTLTTSTLNSALTSSKGAGTWGELSLRRVVQHAGMLDHVDFAEQEGQASHSEDGIGIPDMKILLTGGRMIYVDSKVPLSAYRKASAETDAIKKNEFMAEHAKLVRGHIDNLSSKKYWSSSLPTPEYAIMFVPGEHFITEAFAFDPDLFDYAYRKNVVLAAPSSLLVVLKSAAFTWRESARIENAEKIGKAGEELLKRFVTAFGHLKNVGKGLNSAVVDFNSYVSSVSRMILPAGESLKRLLESEKEIEIPTEIEIEARELDSKMELEFANQDLGKSIE
jgi:DNA recombination protein RmuC